MTETSTLSRTPWVAAVLSLFCTGLGQIYCGRIVPGLVLFLASLMFAPMVVAAAYLEPTTLVLIALIAGLLGVLAVYIFAAVDAFRVARRARDGYQLHDYNHGVIYALFMIVGCLYPIGIMSYLRANYFEAFAVPSGSEVPTIIPEDRILVNKAALRGRLPQRGSVVIFRRPNGRHNIYVKRAIGLPGDTVAVRAGRVYLNGKELEHAPVPRGSLPPIHDALDGEVFSEHNTGSMYRILIAKSQRPIEDYPEHKVPEDTCFVLGDNRNNSADSRAFGFVPAGDILGVAQYIYYPAGSWTRFGAIRSD